MGDFYFYAQRFYYIGVKCVTECKNLAQINSFYKFFFEEDST